MARFNGEIPNELLTMFENLGKSVPEMTSEMCKAGAKIVYDEIVKNIGKSFKKTDKLLKHLKITKAYRTMVDDGINVHVGFYGYDKDSKPTKRHPKGTPIPLIAMAREYGTSSGEKKEPFLRKAFYRKALIEQAMLEVQNRYIKED